MRAAVVQIKTGKDQEKNVQRALERARRAAKHGAHLICFPEMVFGRLNRKEKAQTVDGQDVRAFRALAKELKVGIVLGSIEEEREQRKKHYNTLVAIDDKGKTLAVYRKKHLFKAVIGKRKIDETKIFACGRRNASFLFQGLRFGCGICYDVRFPEMFQSYAKQPCDVIVLPSAFTYQTGKQDWEVLLRARAIETRAFIVAPNKCGNNEEGVKLYGNSMIVDPQGKIIARAKTDQESMLYADLKRLRKI